MDTNPKAQQALALGAALQGVYCVRQLAQYGQVDEGLYRPLIDGLLGNYEGSVGALYGGAGALEVGLRRLVEQLEEPRSLDTTRYLATILQVERRVMRRSSTLDEIAGGLEQARRQAEYFGTPTHSSVIHGLAELYSHTVSAVGPRILVHGQRTYLEDTDTAALLRAILFSAVRAATLWRQNGGGRLRLLLGRRQLAGIARRYLDELPGVGQ